MANNREEAYYGETTDKLKWVEVFLGVLLTLVVVGVLAFVLIFGAGDGGGKAPTIFGNTIYLNKATQIKDILPGVAVIVREDQVENLAAGDTAMCRVGDAESVTLLRVVKVEEAADGVFYTLKTDGAPDNQTIRVGKEDVLAKAISTNAFLGSILSFTSTTLGVVVLVLVPCLLFIGWQITRIIRYRREMEEEAGEVEPEEEDYSGATFQPRGAQPAAYDEYDYDEEPQEAYDSAPVEAPSRPRVIVPKDRVVVPLTGGQTPTTAPQPQQTYINEGRAGYRHGAPPNSNASELASVMQSASRQRAGIPGRPPRSGAVEEQPKPLRTPPTTPSANAANAYSRVAEQSQAPRTAVVQPQPQPRTQPKPQSRPQPRPQAAPTPVTPTPAYSEPIVAQPRRVNPAASFPAPTPHTAVPQREPVMSGARNSSGARPEPYRASELSRPKGGVSTIPPSASANQGVSTIPPSAARPRQTIAPPPKSSNNKALDDLMRSIDEATSDSHKK